MGWTDKALQRHKLQKQVEEVMNMPEYKEQQRQREERALLNAMGRFAFIMCAFLETRHGYKTCGFTKALAFVKSCLESAGEDETFFEEYDKYYKFEYGFDVLGELGLAIEKEGADSGESRPQADTE